MLPLQNPEKLWEAKTEFVVRVTSSRVILADYELIKKDFHEVRNYSDQQIDDWLIRNTSFISTEQAAQDIVNTPISIADEKRLAYRPREYRRAHVFVADTGGLIDAKGTGAIDPSGGSHDNGLATLGDMIREFAYEKLINKIFTSINQFDTVGSYAVIDYGFSIKHPDGKFSEAGVVLRQAHVRYHEGPIGFRSRSQSVMLPKKLQIEIEMALRQFGITSSVAHLNRDLVNLQGAESGAVIDFGSFLVKEKFENPVALFYDTKGNSGNGELITAPGMPNFIQPSFKKQIPFSIWGYTASGKADPKYDNPFIWSHELAESLASGRADRSHAQQHLHNLLDPVLPILKPVALKCSRVYTR